MGIGSILDPVPLVVSVTLGLVVILIVMVRVLIQEKQVLEQAEHSGWWVFTSGGSGKQFFDVDVILTSPEGSVFATNWVSGEIGSLKKKIGRIDKLVFIDKDSGPVGMIAAMSSIVEETRIPGIIVRLRRRVLPGMIKQSRDAPLSEGDIAVIVTDVITTGRGVMKALDQIHRAVPFEINVPYVMTLFDQNKGARARLGEQGIELVSRVVNR